MKTALDPRHQHRRRIVQELFSWEAQRKVGEDRKQKIEDEQTNAVLKKIEEIDTIVSECAVEWKIEKINRIDLAILRLAIYELVFTRTEPIKVVIDEAVELAKEFGGETSPSFVNGVLGQVVTHPTRVKKIIADKIGVEEGKLVPQASLTQDLNLSKIEIADTIASLEKDLGITIDGEHHFQTLGDILNFVEDQQT